jgi:hypothetical protein
VQVLLNEDGDDTSAGAALTVENKMQLRGHGTSTRNPRDGLEPRIGDELPAARALFDLAHQLLSVAASDIDSKTHVPARKSAGDLKSRPGMKAVSKNPLHRSTIPNWSHSA